ncbi:MAG: OmpA family protein, partial [Pseudomonadota bacterium]
MSKLTEQRANYNTAAKLRIYGGINGCERSKMLAETNLIIHTRWIEYNFKFEPQENYSHIIFEAFYNTPTLFPYNGNILLDNASNLKLVPCEEVEEEIIAEETPKDTPVVQQVVTKEPTPPVQQPKPETQTSPVTQPADPPVVATQEPPAQEENKVIESAFSDIKREEIKAGTIIRTNQVYFAADKSDVTSKSFGTLNQLYDFLQDNQDVRIEIGGHTNGYPPHHYCDSLSEVRAQAVVQYLQKKGIASNRLEFKGYGKRQPIAT